jgi:hypothetical protein
MPNQTGFQSFVNNELPVAVAGDFAGANPRASVLSPSFGYVAPAAGTQCGAFGWGAPGTGIAANYYTPNSMLGFVHRDNSALITTFLGFAAMGIVPGNMVTLMDQGDFYGVFAAGATAGQKVYANPLTGLLTAAATGGAVTANSTASSLATTGILTVGATLTGTLAVGQVVTGAGIPDGSYISAQLTGSAGSTGTYQLTNVNGTAFTVVSSETVNFWGVVETKFTVAQNVAVSATATGSSIAAAVSPNTGGILTVGTVTAGVFGAGQFLTGTGLPSSANAQILYQVSGTTGGAVPTRRTMRESRLLRPRSPAARATSGAFPLGLNLGSHFH